MAWSAASTVFDAFDFVCFLPDLVTVLVSPVTFLVELLVSRSTLFVSLCPSLNASKQFSVVWFSPTDGLVDVLVSPSTLLVSLWPSLNTSKAFSTVWVSPVDFVLDFLLILSATLTSLLKNWTVASFVPSTRVLLLMYCISKYARSTISISAPNKSSMTSSDSSSLACLASLALMSSQKSFTPFCILRNATEIRALSPIVLRHWAIRPIRKSICSIPVFTSIGKTISFSNTDASVSSWSTSCVAEGFSSSTGASFLVSSVLASSASTGASLLVSSVLASSASTGADSLVSSVSTSLKLSTVVSFVVSSAFSAGASLSVTSSRRFSSLTWKCLYAFVPPNAARPIPATVPTAIATPLSRPPLLFPVSWFASFVVAFVVVVVFDLKNDIVPSNGSWDLLPATGSYNFGNQKTTQEINYLCGSVSILFTFRIRDEMY